MNSIHSEMSEKEHAIRCAYSELAEGNVENAGDTLQEAGIRQPERSVIFKALYGFSTEDALIAHLRETGIL